MDGIRVFILDSSGGRFSTDPFFEPCVFRLSDACDAFGITNLDPDFVQMLAAEGDRVVLYTTDDQHTLSIITQSGEPLLRLKVRATTAKAYCEMVFCIVTCQHHPILFLHDLIGGEK